MTRFEKIKAMTVEEMAEALLDAYPEFDGHCKGDCETSECTAEGDMECCVKWLKEEAQ